MSRLGIFKIRDVEYDLDDLTLDEVELLEEHAGAVLSDINYASAKAMKAITYILMRRSNPDVTWEEIGKVKVLDFVPAEEEMPALPPDEDVEVSPNGSDLDASGLQGSVVSITG